MATCVYGHSYDKSHPDNKDGCPECLKTNGNILNSTAHSPMFSSETTVAKQAPTSINEWRDAAYENSKAHGFHDEYIDDGAPDLEFRRRLLVAEKLALIHSEVSECLESLRDGHMEEERNHNTGETEGFPSELADVIIRCLDLGGMLGIDIEGAVRRKHEYNKSRPYKHGRKF